MPTEEDEQRARFEQRISDTRAQHEHPDSVEVITHPNYEPYVKLKCRICWNETYVHRAPRPEEPEDAPVETHPTG